MLKQDGIPAINYSQHEVNTEEISLKPQNAIIGPTSGFSEIIISALAKLQ